MPGSSFDAVRQELLQKGRWKGELHHVTKDGRRLIVESQAELVPVDGRRYVLESTRDITHSKTLEARQQLLVAELAHRVKNLLTVVQGMVHQTWRCSNSAEEFIEKLEGRIAALASSQKLLANSEWEGTDLRRLVEHQLAPYGDQNGQRLQLVGEPVALPAHIATPLGLVLHELATNAAKYGAFSTDKGQVELRWQLNSRNDPRLLKVVWKEHDGPRVDGSPSAGFGSRLIGQGLPGATVKHEFLAEGVRCAIELPIPAEGA